MGHDLKRIATGEEKIEETGNSHGESDGTAKEHENKKGNPEHRQSHLLLPFHTLSIDTFGQFRRLGFFLFHFGMEELRQSFDKSKDEIEAH